MSIMSYAVRLLCLLSVAAALATNLVHAAVFNVDTIVDDPGLTGCDDAAPSDCSLRGAILKANGLSEPVTINVPAGTYVLSQATDCRLTGTTFVFFHTQALCPTGNLTIAGAGADATIIDANQPIGNIGVVAPVMFIATTASVTVSGVTMRNGNFSASSIEGYGGGIDNAGTLTLTDSAITQNWTGGNGGGIYNQGNLTLLRSVVSRNFSAQAGGGIWNTNLFGTCLAVSPCHDGQGVVTISNSTISENVATFDGGGIGNFVGMLDVVGSTIDDNVAAGSGGGIYNAAFNVNLTNVTVSGNHASGGGGIFNNGPTYSTQHWNNVTIANNTAQWANDPTRGIGGGVINLDFGTVTLRNTIIAGNFAAELSNGQPLGTDCFAPVGSSALTSAGYNLIQTPNFCDISGDTTGNVLGKDAKLGVLTDNGGLTLTQALGDGSPAIDAGNPASPGSGGVACAAIDQRGFPRPLGAACDIGALERTGAFALTRILPIAGGNFGSVTTLVSGNGFVDGSTVKLTRAGQPDIVGSPIRVDQGGSAISTTFDLRDAAVGMWNVVVIRPDSTSKTLSAAFNVQATGGPDLWVDVTGFFLDRHVSSRLTLFYGNRGNVDAFGVPLALTVSNQYGLTALFDIAQPPSQPDQRLTDFTQVPVTVRAGASTGYTNLPLLLPIVPAGFTGMLQILLVLPATPTSASTFFANIDTPYFNPTLDPQVVSAQVTGAIAYSPGGLGITISPTLVPYLQQYVTNQLQLAVKQGRDAFVASLGNAPQVYSHAQLYIDAAIVGAVRTVQP
jgi:hypothetical protein